jgi:hypothetical protein
LEDVHKVELMNCCMVKWLVVQGILAQFNHLTIQPY